MHLGPGLHVAAVLNCPGQIFDDILHQREIDHVRHGCGQHRGIALCRMGEHIQTGHNGEPLRHARSKGRIDHCKLTHAVDHQNGHLAAVLRVRNDETVGQLRTGTGGGGYAHETQGLLHLLRRVCIIQDISAVYPENVDALCGINGAAAADTHNTVAACCLAQSCALVHDFCRRIRQHLIEFHDLESGCLQAVQDLIDDAGCLDAAVIDHKGLPVSGLLQGLAHLGMAVLADHQLHILHTRIIDHKKSLLQRVYLHGNSQRRDKIVILGTGRSK